MEYKACFYEALTRHMYVNWSVLLNHSFSEEQVRSALCHVHSKHPYLRCTIREGPSFGVMTLVDKGSNIPVLSCCESVVDEEVIHTQLELAADAFENDATIEDTVHYHLLCDHEHNRTGLIATFCHSCVDALSSLRVAADILYFLDHPDESLPPSRDFVSVQAELIVEEKSSDHIRFANQKEQVLLIPSRLHEDSEGVHSYFRTHKVLLSEDLMHSILTQCHNYGCSFQSVLWSTMVLCLMRFFHISLPQLIRFGTPATTVGRAAFRKPIDKEDLVVGAYTVYVTQKLDSEMSFWNLCQCLHTSMREEMEKKEQMNDFFAVCRDKSFSALPVASFNGCTLGVVDVQKQYDHFDVESFYFLPGATRSPGMAGMNLHAFSIPGMGCSLNCTYVYPALSEEDMEVYGSHLLSLFKRASTGDWTLQEGINSLSF